MIFCSLNFFELTTYFQYANEIECFTSKCTQVFQCGGARLNGPIGLHLVHIILADTKKYPLPGYILGLLTHTIAQKLHWRGGETPKQVSIHIRKLASPHLIALSKQHGFAYLMDPRGLRVSQTEYFSFVTFTRELLLMTFCDTS